VSTREWPVDADRIVRTAAALRRVFDESFAAAESSITGRLENLLAIRVAAGPYALRLPEITGLHADRKIIPVPSPEPHLLGIVGLRGMMAPVYDLAALLRYPPVTSPRWMVLAGGSQAVGFAFEIFEAHVQVPQAAVSSDAAQSEGNSAPRQYTRGTVRAAGALRPIIHLTSIVEMIRGKHS
jgi:chemotaxis signal transduction protein